MENPQDDPEIQIDPAAADGAMRLSEYLETPESEWLHKEIEGQPDDYPVQVDLPGPEGSTLRIEAKAGDIRLLVAAMVQNIEAESLDEGDDESIPLHDYLQQADPDEVASFGGEKLTVREIREHLDQRKKQP